MRMLKENCSTLSSSKGEYGSSLMKEDSSILKGIMGLLTIDEYEEHGCCCWKGFSSFGSSTIFVQ